MGLLEKALNFKKKLNSRGEKTLIDTIKGPAETDIVKEDVFVLDSNDLQPLSGEQIVLTEDEIQNRKVHEQDNSRKEVLTNRLKNDTDLKIQKNNEGGHGPEKKKVADFQKKNSIKQELNMDESNSDNNTNAQNLEGEFSDFMLLYEIQKEIVRARSADELYETILFSLMGQIGASSSSIMVRDPKNVANWIIIASKGVEIDAEMIRFDPTRGILKELFSRKEIIDLDEFKNKSEFRDDYYKYISIDAKVLVPLIQGYEILGTVILGEKLTSEMYTDEDKEFLTFVGEVSAISLNNISTMEMILKVNENLSKDFGAIRDADYLQEKLISVTSISKASEIVYQDFNNMGIEQYAIFVKNKIDDSFIPLFVDKDDNIKIKTEDFKIKKNTNFVNFIHGNVSPMIVNNFFESPLVFEVFTERQIAKMTLFRLYSFMIGDKLFGFIIVFRTAEHIDLQDADSRMIRVSRFIIDFSSNIMFLDTTEKRYIDSFKINIEQIQDEIINSRNLGIPLTLILFSIKNFKRFYAGLGNKAVEALLNYFEETIKKRLADKDFSIRYDINKIMIVLPGKNKKYAIPLANSIRNELVNQFSQKNIQLLITFLSAEYPKDGDDIYSLLDTLD